MSTLSLRQKWRTRNLSVLDYLHAGRDDSRQLIYKLLPLVTEPRRRQALGRLWALFKPSSHKLELGEEVTEQLAQLRREGVLTGLPAIDAPRLKDILDYFQSQPCQDPWRPHLGLFPWDQAPSQECNMGTYTAEQIVRAPHVMALFNHPRLLALAEGYIGCKPTLDNVGCWWSYSRRSVAKGTQKFHRDFDSIGGFKVFFYLTDVGTEQGPHEYLRGSHAQQTLDTGAAIAEDLLWKHYESGRSLVITGKAGTSFLVDTFGIHRGQLPTEGWRLMLSAQYNINMSPHGPQQPFSVPGGQAFDAYINRLYLQSPWK